MSTESDTNQNINAISSERKPFTQEERDYFISLMNGPDETCRELNDYGHRLLGHPIHISYIDSRYRVIGVNNELTEFRSRWWDLGESPVHAKKHLYREYLFRLYGRKDIPHHIKDLIRNACNSYNEWLTATWGLVRTLKLKDIDQREFIETFETDCRSDGGINCDSIVSGYWTEKMVEQKLCKFDPDRSPESIHEELMPNPKPKREPKKKPEVKPEQKSKVKPESPSQDLIYF